MMKLLLIFLVCVQLSFSAFPTCQTQEFCREIRDGTKQTNFFVNSSAIGIIENEVYATIYDDNGRNFDLKAYSLDGGIFRVKIEDSANPRYDLKDVLSEDLKFLKPDVTITGSYLTLRNDNSELKIFFEPFGIEVWKNYDLIIKGNSKGRLNFNTDEDNSAISCDFVFSDAQVAYGIPQHAERLSLQNTLIEEDSEPYRLFNNDYCCYPIGTKEALYGSIPVLYGHGAKRTSGVFWLNAAQTFVDIDTTEDSIESLFISQTGTFDVFFLTGPTLKFSVLQYSSLTGKAPLPPLFSLGHHQSRWSYMSQEDALTVVREMDNNDFAFDVIWLDIDYTDNFKYFTWDLEAFPNPVEMQNEIDSTGRKLVLIIDPHIKREEGYFVFDVATENRYFVRDKNGDDFKGSCWPGSSSWLDFLNPSAAEYYASLFTYFPNTTDIVHIWNDMNEPSVFAITTNTMPDHNLHYGDVTHGEVHNIYGFSQTLNTHKGLLDRYDNTKRPFVLTRSHFAGSQRHTAVWTGDNIASWEHLKISIPMCLTLALSGISNCGADIGGFVGDVTEELLQRWYQTGAWLPFFRAHSSEHVPRREPYLFGDDVQVRIRNAITERYNHIPLWYTLFYEHERFGEPIIRPLSYHYPDDANTLVMDEEFLVGTDVLVRTVTEESVTNIPVYFPGGSDEYWYNIVDNLLYFGTGYENIDVDLDSIPVFYRGGSIVARLEERRPSTQHTHEDAYTIYLFLDQNGYASSTLYIDDFETFAYREKKEYKYVQMMYTGLGGFRYYTVDDDAEFDRDITIAKLIVYRNPESDTKRFKEATVNGKVYPVRQIDDYRFEVEDLDLKVDRECQVLFG